jgi:23S rRNA (cytosine1962-C5)-methyltransferase
VNRDRIREPSPGSLILHEDEHLLVVNKPAGINTHAPAPYAGEGLYDWLRHREPRWANLSILQRLDKETSGVLVFGKTAVANRSLAAQFSEHTIQKRYVFVTDRIPKHETVDAVSGIARAGDKYVVRPISANAPRAQTRFRVLRREAKQTWVEAEPVTGRTHQIRVHAAAHGFPILGDALYGGANSRRVCLHAQSLTLAHPETRQAITFAAEPDFESDSRLLLRRLLIDSRETTVCRLIHGAADNEPGWYLDQLGEHLLSQSESAPDNPRMDAWAESVAARSIYHKHLERHVRRVQPSKAGPQLVRGAEAPERFVVRENGLHFELSFQEGYSVGLFLDQRDNRRRFLANHVAADFPLFEGGASGREVLNTFSYTCAFSVCAARAGARAISLDLSKKYLEWGRRNFAHNQIDPAAHDFIYGDVFDWLKRFAKKERRFDALILDPPTFSQSKTSGTFRAESDYEKLLELAAPLLKPQGVLLASTNAGALMPEKFAALVKETLTSRGRRILAEHYVPQPIDFPISRDEPAHLKSLWLRLA